ncbi:MAG: ligase-associated DNA damage response endonuclease PdeM [Bacteroidota bacterium]
MIKRISIPVHSKAFVQQHIVLSPQRCLFWEEEQMLVLADLHIGKAAHFRKAGIPIPQALFQEDLIRLFDQVNFFRPRSILISGDMFHSAANLEHDWFSKWRTALGGIEIQLVRGNHEILHDDEYARCGVHVMGSHLEKGPFTFSHELPHQLNENSFYFIGHTHPGVRLSGKGKQQAVLPCFHLTDRCCTLPAFSAFSGKHIVEPKKQDRVYAILQDKGSAQLMAIPH